MLEEDRVDLGLDLREAVLLPREVDDGLLVLDVSAPERPRQVFRDVTPNRAWDVLVVDDRAYVLHADDSSGAVRAYVHRARTSIRLWTSDG